MPSHAHRRARPVALAACALLLVAGCHVDDLQRDASIRDAAGPDAGAIDASQFDLGPSDAGDIDASNTDLGAADASVFDAGDIDASNADLGAVDASVFDLGPSDAGDIDASNSDLGAVDASVFDAGDIDASLWDAGLTGLDVDGDGVDAARDCDDADPDNWDACARCADADADGLFAGCDAYRVRRGPDCVDAPWLAAVPGLALSELTLASTFESVGARVRVASAAPDPVLTLRVCAQPGAASGGGAWVEGSELFPVGDAGLVLGSALFLRPDTDYEVEVSATSPSTGTRAVIRGAVHTRTESLVAPAGRVVFVSQDTGDDASVGSETAPLRSVARALALTGPGDVIELLPGVYRGSIVLTGAGRPDAPRVLRGRAGAVVDGADPALAAGPVWRDEGGGVYSCAFSLAGTAVTELRYVALDDARLYPYSTARGHGLADLRTTTAAARGAFWHDAVASRLYVRAVGDASPAGRTLHAAVHDVGVHVDRADDWRLEGLEIRYFSDTGILVRGGARPVVRANSIHHVNDGIALVVPYGAPPLLPRDARVEDNHVRDTGVWSWGYAACKTFSCERTGIYAPCAPGHVIRRNVVEGVFNGLGAGDGVDHDVFVEVPLCNAEGDLSDNLVREVADDGIELDGAGVNQRIFRNRITARHTNGISLSPLDPGPVFVVRNVVDGFSEAFVKLRDEGDDGWKIVAHNTAWTDAPGAIPLQPPARFGGLVMQANVLAAPSYAVFQPAGATWSVTLDGNLWWSERAPGATRFIWSGVNYTTLAAWSAATGFETRGLDAPPALDAEGRPLPGSPALDAAPFVRGVSGAVPDGRPDIGAFER